MAGPTLLEIPTLLSGGVLLVVGGAGWLAWHHPKSLQRLLGELHWLMLVAAWTIIAIALFTALPINGTLAVGILAGITLVMFALYRISKAAESDMGRKDDDRPQKRRRP
nr:hypothetical protein [Sphingomonas sp. SCN 67-18]